MMRLGLLLTLCSCVQPAVPELLDADNVLPRDALPPVVSIEVTPPSSIVLGSTVAVSVVLPVQRSGVLVRLVQGADGVGTGACPPVLAGDCLGVVGDRVIYSGVSDASGEALIDVSLPTDLASSRIGLQAVVVFNGSAFLSSPVVVPVGLDADQDGVVSSLDCDDDDPFALSRLDDGDCDGFPTVDDCDDADALTACGLLDCDSGACLPNYSVYGQRDLTGVSRFGAWPTADGLASPEDVLAIDGFRFVLDSGNHRVVVYDESFTSPVGFLGQTSGDQGAANAARGSAERWTLHSPRGMCTDGSRLAVVDTSNNRVLLFRTVSPQPFLEADVVIGQPDGVSVLANRGQDAPSADTLSYPTACAFHEGGLWVADGSNGRVLAYDTIPTQDGAPATRVIGQADMVTGEPNRGGSTSELGLSYPSSVRIDGGSLIVTDLGNQRVVIWDAPPLDGTVAPDVVLGQSTRTSAASGGGLQGMYYPTSAARLGGQFVVSDRSNNRLLVWNAMPTVDGQPADFVYGQDDATGVSANRGGVVSATGLSGPSAMVELDSQLYLVDSWNHRILSLGTMPLDAGRVPLQVIGQPDFDTALANRKGTDAFGFDAVGCMEVSEDQLLVCDRYNGRVAILDRERTGAASSAEIFLGKPSETEACLGYVSPCSGVTGPSNLTVSIGAASDAAGGLYLSDRYNHRVLVYSEPPTQTGQPADFVLGQDDFDGGSPNAGSDGAGWISQPSAVLVHGDHLYVADKGNHRILRYDLPITQNHQPATMVIGQPDFTTTSAGTAADKIDNPMGLHIEDDRLFVVEYSNSRVTVFDGLPEVPGAAADFVIGQPDMVSRDLGTTASMFGGYMQVESLDVFDGFLYVPDRQNRRILGFDLASLATGMSASRVFGQPDFDSAEFFTSTRADELVGLSGPSGIQFSEDGTEVFIADMWSHRVIRVRTSEFLSRLVYADAP